MENKYSPGAWFCCLWMNPALWPFHFEEWNSIFSWSWFLVWNIKVKLSEKNSAFYVKSISETCVWERHYSRYGSRSQENTSCSSICNTDKWEFRYNLSTRSQQSLQTSTSSWRPFGSLDFEAEIAYSSTLIELFVSYTSSSTLYTADSLGQRVVVSN